MKVTVCFGSVRVVVPCGDGNILVKDLIREAILRYKKATGKSPDSWVVVHNLQTQGGGILDHDDRLNDVVDDREQILASFEDGDGSHHHGGGDGASGSSSVGTGSPDIFNDGNHKYVPSYPRTEIEVTGEQLAMGAAGALHVRRGSEPALNQLPIGPPPSSDNIKRWSAAPLIIEPTTAGNNINANTGYCNSDWEDSRYEDDDPGYFRISRDGSKRLSMQFLGDGSGYRWAEAAERAASHSSTSLPRGSKRKEPLGQANNTSPIPYTQSDNASELIVIRNEPGPLGIHVVPDYDILGKEKGLLVQGIEPSGRIDRDGRLAVNDHIIEINAQSVINMPFQRVQELFKLSLTAAELRLRVQKGIKSEGIHKPAAFLRLPEDKENISMVECEQKQNINSKVATVSPTKKVPATPRNFKSLISANTRKIGRKIELELTKGPHGLGFSITTRDNPAGGNCPIYIKNIIPKGAAVEDGRLKIGDRLLEVNGIEMTGKSQSEAVSILRNVPPGSKVRIVVSRQEDVPDNNLARTVVLEADDERAEDNNVPQIMNRSQEENTTPAIPPLPQSHIQNQQIKQMEKNNSVAKIISQFQEANEKCEDGQIFPWKHREILTFDIPVHDSEKAGLGISVKGKTSGSQDLGIFIKSVIHGGAASRDKRLRTNDQLLNVNGVSLLHQSNSDAMETLRKAMLHTEGPVPGSITLTIARRASSPGPNRNNSRRNSSAELLDSSTGSDIYRLNDSETSRNESSDPSGGSSNTVIYNPRKHSHTEINSNSNINQNFSPMQTWNPVLDRLTNHNKQLRNESYYIATHDTWSTSMLTAANQSSGKVPPQTVNLNSGETILVEDDYGPRVLPHQNSRNPLPNCNNLPSKPETQNNVDITDSKILQNCDKSTESSQTTATNNDVTYASQLSLEQPNPATFCRDAFGRQSMSEKRHAALDAKNTDTYQRTKKMREERDKNKQRETNLVRVGSVESVISVNRSSEHPEQADKLGQLGPSLGMKKSSSLESLQTMVQEMQMQEEGDPAYCYRNNAGLKVVRGRGCEESFRAAVIDPNHRSETTAKKHWLLDPPANERQVDGFTNVRGGPRQSSLNANLDGKHKGGKKKPGIFKGIGSMFRFGKHRKMDFSPPEQYKPQGEGIPEKPPPQPPQQQKTQSNDNHPSQSEIKNEKALDQRNNNNNCNERLTEQLPPEPLYHRHGFIQGYAEQAQVIPEGSALTSTSSRSNVNHGQYDQNHNRGERSQLMRAYEQRQAQRQAYYQQNGENNKTDQTGRQRLDPGPYGEYGKPGSRFGISEPIRFTHYVNYDELQNHISRKQQQYHSQRQMRQDNQLRPVSNFYEYESVQSILNAHGKTDRPAPPPIAHVHQHSDSYQETVGSSSLNRHQGGLPLRTVANSRSIHPNHFSQNRGPFITQVLIGDHVQHSGSRV